MNTKKIKIAVSFLVILIVSILIFQYKKNDSCEGCGGCDYKKFVDSVKVEKIVWEKDSIDFMYLKSTIDTNIEYQIDRHEFEMVIEKNFDEKLITDTLNKYRISGEIITKGSCAPYIIEKMKLCKK
ncbi:hypothetical protein [Flavobacterium pedocola]